jgi:hypothetical protein
MGNRLSVNFFRAEPLTFRNGLMTVSGRWLCFIVLLCFAKWFAVRVLCTAFPFLIFRSKLLDSVNVCISSKCRVSDKQNRKCACFYECSTWYLASREEQRLTVFEDRAFEKSICTLEVNIGGLWTPHNEDFPLFDFTGLGHYVFLLGAREQCGPKSSISRVFELWW